MEDKINDLAGIYASASVDYLAGKTDKDEIESWLSSMRDSYLRCIDNHGELESFCGQIKSVKDYPELFNKIKDMGEF